MRLFGLFALVFLAGLSYQSSWQDLLGLTEDQAHTFLHSGVLKNQGDSSHGTIAPPHFLQVNSVVQRDPVPVDPHQQATSASDHGQPHRIQSEFDWSSGRISSEPTVHDARTQPHDPGATSEGVSAADPRHPPIFEEELPVPPQPLTLQERYAILEEAAERLDSKRKKEANVLHPFIGRQVPQRVIHEFAVSRALLREFKPGHFVQARMRDTWLEHEGTGFRPEKEGKRHLFVYRLDPEQTSQRPGTILSFVVYWSSTRKPLA